jgi:hypothetical protein
MYRFLSYDREKCTLRWIDPHLKGRRAWSRRPNVDVVMLAGAGLPLHLGGLVPALDRGGAAERVTGRRLLDCGVAGMSARDRVPRRKW